MTIIDGIPTWQHEDFIFRNPTIDVKDNYIMIGWIIIEKDTEVLKPFKMELNIDLLKNLCTYIDPSNHIMHTIIDESIKWIVEYVKDDVNFKDKMSSVEFSSNLMLEVHTWFVNDNKTVLNTFENMIKENLMSRIYKSLKKYFKETPKDQLDKDYKEISEKYEGVETTVEEWLKYNKLKS